MSYTRITQIEFNHCDPAGIVFYPRYFEMINSVIENFFAEVLGYSFARMSLIEHVGVPTVHIEADFKAPSRLGEKVTFQLFIRKIGGSSVTFLITAHHGGEARLTADMTLVWVNSEGKAARWPEELGERIVQVMNEELTP